MKEPSFVVIDYGLGNLRSVKNALAFPGCEVRISDQPRDVERATALILPGVGAFGEAMQNLGKRQLVRPIRTAVLDNGIPLLGICLGVQRIAERGEERGTHEGLGLIPGHFVHTCCLETEERFVAARCNYGVLRPFHSPALSPFS